MITRKDLSESIRKGIIEEVKAFNKKYKDENIFAYKVILDDYALSAYMLCTSEEFHQNTKLYKWDTDSWERYLSLEETQDMDYSLYHSTKLFFDFYNQREDTIDDLDKFRYDNIETYMKGIVERMDEFDDLFFILSSEDDKSLEDMSASIMNYNSKYLKEFLDRENHLEDEKTIEEYERNHSHNHEND